MTDGLSMLNKKREQATRQRPPTRHPRAVPDADPAPAPETTLATEQERAKPDFIGPSTTTKVTVSTEQTTIPRSVQLDEDTDEFLDHVRSAGRRARVDANRSAVIRYALRKLRDQEAPDQIAEALRAEKPRHGKAGRRIV